MNEQSLIKKAQLELAQNSPVTSSFSQLVTLYQQRLYHYLLGKCRSTHDAEDVLQETFINAYKYLHSYNARWQFSTWLFTIANRLLSQHNHVKYENIHSTQHHTTELDDSAIDQHNIWAQVKLIVSGPAYDVLWFFYIEELSIKEIAIILQRSQSWVKISLFRSKRKLAANTIIRNLSQDFL